ncbi:MAG: hypothetical protein HQK51_19340, partial [Oligoflexia bacterium]|nr:hypothetical protein [Oligoflexia bacterium]
ATTEKQILKNKNIILLAPSLIHKHHDEFTIGFITQKSNQSKSYFFNAFVTFFIADDRYQDDPLLKTGVLGFKGGLLLPTNPWVPLLLNLSFGFAKTAVQKDPWFGKKSQTEKKKDMLLLEGGFLYHYKIFFVNGVYQAHNLKTMSQKIILSAGVNF